MTEKNFIKKYASRIKVNQNSCWNTVLFYPADIKEALDALDSGIFKTVVYDSFDGYTATDDYEPNHNTIYCEGVPVKIKRVGKNRYRVSHFWKNKEFDNFIEQYKLDIKGFTRTGVKKAIEHCNDIHDSEINTPNDDYPHYVDYLME